MMAAHTVESLPYDWDVLRPTARVVLLNRATGRIHALDRWHPECHLQDILIALHGEFFPSLGHALRAGGLPCGRCLAPVQTGLLAA